MRVPSIKTFKSIREKRSNMKKIVMLSGNTKHDELLMAFISVLFPECEIQVFSKGMRIEEECRFSE